MTDLNEVRRLLDQEGYAYLAELPQGFDHLEFLSGLGEVLPQYDGRRVWDLVPEPGMDDVYHSRNTQALVPHTEGYELPGLPPRYVALWCVRPAEGVGGETTLADGYALLERFSPDDRAAMRDARYTWRSSEGLARKGIVIENRHPIVTRHRDRWILRFSENNVEPTGDQLLGRVIREGTRFFEREHRAVSIVRNGLLAWDNWRMIHSRNAFVDRGRHLKRVLLGS
ncbi:TauD/TfdA family dioxygenase [Yinghuangia seranimata]|uniref:TauD/TfdA family dioxygenase n=1 Tax=Yinghuangia seranimata TaxID=408067 RepID=UPI00248CB4A5|nr:TauD/TfdA family dioxygenase [Yinghuangia seranimata]MDI2132422.1 TauD/TfdA family dioxygenase [Yinghuangia seranimata]